MQKKNVQSFNFSKKKNGVSGQIFLIDYCTTEATYLN